MLYLNCSRVSLNEVLDNENDPRGITVSCVPNAWCALVIPGVWYCTGRNVVNTTVEIKGLYFKELLRQLQFKIRLLSNTIQTRSWRDNQIL